MWVDPFSLRLASPLGTATGEITERRGVLVGLTHEGSDGLGEATPLPGWTESYEVCRRTLETVASRSTDSSVIDSPDPTETPAAAHAVECARLDAIARRDSRPLAAVLREGAFDTDRPTPDSVPVNATVGDGDVEETVRAATEAVDGGFACLKLKVGAQSPAADLARVEAVREAVDDDVSLRLDANGAWDRSTAHQMIGELTDTGIDYLEQPLSVADLAGHAEIRGRGLDIAVDESVIEHSTREIIDAGAADVIVLKPMALGGPRRAVETAAAARSAGIEPVITTTVDAVVARTAAVHAAAAIPEIRACGLATGSLLSTDLAADPVSLTGGEMSLPTGEGLCGTGFAELRQGVDRE